MRPPRRHATRATVLLAGLGLAACSGTADKDDTAQEARQAIADKTDENIALAQEYIDKGGEYTRAIEIFEQFLLADPGNEKLLAAKARAEEMRYMTLDRFAKVTKGMTEEQVRELLGTPKRTNVSEFDRGVIGWFYARRSPRRPPGSSSAANRGSSRSTRPTSTRSLARSTSNTQTAGQKAGGECQRASSVRGPARPPHPATWDAG